ncbi:heme exporter protein CcmD [uncultured Shewanella sp.]|uniref:heme exporter protein CcmD n=1 Tax=uncultured Shewanella sp. TaxID=173975 RepID=UPI00260FD58B|nr:heme exporter protein CcmD [uncultured Shewanella sp.]
MQFDSISDFFNMGGYAFYVWLSYGVTLVCFGLLIIFSKVKKKQLFKHINQKIQREQLLKARRSNKQ